MAQKVTDTEGTCSSVTAAVTTCDILPWGKQKPLHSSRSWGSWQLCNLPTDLFLFPLPGRLISNQDCQDPAFHFPQPMEAISSCDPWSHTLDNLPAAALGRNGHLKIFSSLPTPKNVLWISPQKPPNFQVQMYFHTFLFFSHFDCTHLFMSCLCRAHALPMGTDLQEKIFCEVSRFPEIQQRNFFPHLSILDYSKGKSQIIWHWRL